MHSILYKLGFWLCMAWLASCHPSTTLHPTQAQSQKNNDRSQSKAHSSIEHSVKASPHSLLVLKPGSNPPSSASSTFHQKLMNLIYRFANVLIIHRPSSALKTTADSPLHDPGFLQDTQNYLSEDMYQYVYSAHSRPILRSFKIDTLGHRLKRLELRRKENKDNLKMEKKRLWREEVQEHALKSMRDWIRRHRKIGLNSQKSAPDSTQSPPQRSTKRRTESKNTYHK